MVSTEVTDLPKILKLKKRVECGVRGGDYRAA